MNLQDEIKKGLKDLFRFKKTSGEWWQEGLCPDCGKHEAFCAADEPKIVRCGRQDRCGWEDSVRRLLPDLFEDWSKRYPTTEADPNAAADAYLQHERGLDMRYLRGAYTQELYRDGNQTGATVRFPLAGTHWERIIDRPGRFEKKAHFRKGGTYKGHCWVSPIITMDQMAKAKEIVFAEGIFDTVALCMVGHLAVSCMSTNNWPGEFLAQLRAALEAVGRSDRPKLTFAFDVGAAGVKWTKRHVRQARAEGWDAGAMQVRPDGEGTKLDWNDLLLRHLDWDGDDDKFPLGPEAFETFRYNGEITIAANHYEKAKLIAARRVSQAKAGGFHFRHANSMYWGKINYGEESADKGLNGKVSSEEICNCAFRLLYRERDEIIDETTYFLQLDFQDQETVKARFSSAACASSGEFKKRMLDFAGSWSGTGEQLDKIIRVQTRKLKVVQPIAATGYSPEHKAWVLGDLAVHNGRVLRITDDKYFDIGKKAVKLRSSQQLLDIAYNPDQIKFDWLPHVFTAWGPKGLIVLAFFTMSLFAVQIRKEQASLGFLEVTGEAGAGKSTLIEFCWKMMGRDEYEGDDPNKGTVAFFARTLLQVANLPVGLIEGKRDEDGAKARRFDYNDLLVFYNGRSPRGTGAKTNGNETYSPPFLGSIYLMQNERIDGIPAVLERLMSLRIDKSMWSDATTASALKIEAWPMEEVSGTIVHIVRQEAEWMSRFRDRYAYHDHRDKAMRRRVPGLHNARPVKCHSQLAAAVEALPMLFPTCQQAWVDETLKMVDAMALDRQESCGGDHPLVASFWEKVEYLLAREGPEIHGEGKSINQHRRPDTTMAVSLVDFEAKCRNAGISVPEMDKLKTLLRGSKSHKFIANKPVNTQSGKPVKCWVFEWSAPSAEGRMI